jgi:dihydroneopterin aldolase
MLTVSLHGIRLHALHGLYPQEQIVGNVFEIDVDIFISASGDKQLPFVDYSMIHKVTDEAFKQPGQLLETFALYIHTSLKEKVPEAEKIKVTIRKMHPPLPGDIRYAQVCYEN